MQTINELQMVTIQHRALVEVNTEWQWTPWSDLESGVTPHSRAENRLEFWRGLTAYAVSQRGKSATKEYRIKENDHD